MQDRILKALIFIIVAAGFLVYSTFFIVKETHQAIVLQLGEPKKVYKDAGLYWKIPLLQNVQLIDKRVLEIDAPAEEGGIWNLSSPAARHASWASFKAWPLS